MSVLEKSDRARLFVRRSLLDELFRRGTGTGGAAFVLVGCAAGAMTGMVFKETGTDVSVGVDSCDLKNLPLFGCLANLASKSLLLINGGGTLIAAMG